MASPEPDFAWARQGAPARLLSLLNTAGEARFVGGCVRDSLIGLPPGPPGRTDIDIATTLTPERTMEVLRQQKIRVIPTGVEHGTVTAVIDHVPYEITTLRADVETDGRRAVVAFTTDWREDAVRRDFTINSLYLTPAGEIIDYWGGRDDLAAGRVRFIGEAERRIREDYLRILRFLRFSARFALTLDEEGWAECVALKDGIDGLSRERLWSETSRLFSTPRAPMAIRAAAEEGVLAKLCPATARPERFAALHLRLEGTVPPALGLAALWPEAGREALKMAFKPSTATLDRYDAVLAAADLIEECGDARLCLYRHGREAALEGFALAASTSESGIDDSHGDVLAGQDVPVLPVKGADFVARGFEKGPPIGAAMARFEELWIRAGFPTAPEAVERLLDDAAKGA